MCQLKIKFYGNLDYFRIDLLVAKHVLPPFSGFDAVVV